MPFRNCPYGAFRHQKSSVALSLTDLELKKQLEANKGKDLYGYQENAINTLMSRMDKFPDRYNLLFQLPTGGGKTVIFSELAKRYILNTGKRVLILTHRIELCGQTSRMLTDIGIPNKIINSKVKELDEEDDHWCFVAMVETLNNRLNDERIEFENLGLVVIDEAHYNSFRKLFGHFSNQIILGVTATPLSSNVKLPLKDNYNELIVGESISSLVEQEFLAKAVTYSYDVNLRSLKIGINGDYTVSSSNDCTAITSCRRNCCTPTKRKPKAPKPSSSTTASTPPSRFKPCSSKRGTSACTWTTPTARRNGRRFRVV